VLLRIVSGRLAGRVFAPHLALLGNTAMNIRALSAYYIFWATMF
jgi:hypothetical protein